MKKDINRILIKYYASLALFLAVCFVPWYFICQRVQSGFVPILFFALFYVAYALIEYARYRIALEEKPLRAAIEEYYDKYEILDTYWVEDPY